MVKENYVTGNGVSTMLEKIEAVLNEKVRPKLAEHGGDLKVLKYEGGVVHIQLLGQCSNCPSAYLTTESVIQAQLMEALPEIEQVVVDQTVSDELWEQAKSILRGDPKWKR